MNRWWPDLRSAIAKGEVQPSSVGVIPEELPDVRGRVHVVCSRPAQTLTQQCSSTRPVVAVPRDDPHREPLRRRRAPNRLTPATQCLGNGGSVLGDPPGGANTPAIQGDQRVGVADQVKGGNRPRRPWIG